MLLGGRIAGIILLAVVYAIAARVGLALDAVGGFATLVWAPTGISIAALLIFGTGIAPGVALGALTANLIQGAPISVACGIAAGNTLEALAATMALERAGFRRQLDRLRDVLAYILLAACAAPLLSATIGVLSLFAGGVIASEKIGVTFSAWWLGDLIGALVVGPLILTFADRAATRRPLEFGALLAGAAFTGSWVFSTLAPGSLTPFRQSYVVFPILIFAALRLGPRGAASCGFVVSAIAIAGTIAGGGPYHHSSIAESLMFLQAFMAITTSVALILAAVAAERSRVAAALIEADQRKDAFLAVLAHELRNPLAPIRSAVHLLRMKEGGAEQFVPRLYDVIDRQVTHLSRLVEDLLDVSRITTGKISLRKEPIDLCSLVRTTIEDHRAMFERGSISLEVSLPQEPLFVNGDPTRLAQIVGNILHNASKFCDAGAKVFVALRREPGDRVSISVKDTGMGIEPEFLAHVFDTFAQADRSLDRSRGGLGIGLALVKGLVELHGGEVRATSDGLGKGSELVVRLPLEPRAPAPAAAPARAGGEKRARRILIIEDNVDAADTLCALLEMLGHEAQTASTGQSGLNKAKTFAPDIILCDIGLPGELDGYGVARAVRADPALKDVYLIALTGYGQAEDRKQAFDAGFDEHFTKPVESAELERSISAHKPRGTN